VRHRWVLALLTALVTAAGGAAHAGPKKPPPPPGIRWESTLAGARERAQREGRPLLICVNALEGQVSTLVTDTYPSEAWGRATRGYVCLVANQVAHEEKDGVCSRFGQMPCACHRDTLAWVVRNFADEKGDIISPSHLILEPDGGVAFREDYFDARSRTGPTLFETVLSAVSPDLAQRIAGIEREAKIAEIGKAPAEKAGELARAWMAVPDDGLRVAGLLSALVEAEAPPKRLALIAALAQAPGEQVPALVPTVEGVTAVPDERPEETVAWVTALLRVDRDLGAWAAARAFVRAKQPATKKRVLALWTGAEHPEDATLPSGERAALAEALHLAGQPVPPDLRVDDTEGTAMVPLARRMRARLRVATGGVPLPKDLAGLAPGALRAALLDARGEDVVKRKADVLALLRGSPHRRVRIAAAVVLFRARERADGLVEQILLDGAFDPVEGPETRALVMKKRLEELADDREAWAKALHDALTGAR
jgi:hypothetical protein